MSTKRNLDLAKLKADDEFYTSFIDIAAELDKWKHKFKGKTIICPCDFNPDTKVESITIEFSPLKFFINSVEKNSSEVNVIDLFGISEGGPKKKEVSESVIRRLLSERNTCNFIYYLWTIAEETGIKSITASGYNIKTKSGVSFDEVDYTKYDLCITNPPFSLYSAFMECLIREKNNRQDFHFILIAPFMNRVAPCIAEPLMERKVWLGYGRHLAMEFKNPTGGKNKKVAVDWITTWPDAQIMLNKSDINSKITYDKMAYKDMTYMTMKDGTKPIKINSVSQIPEDYFGWMFTSVAVLDKLNYDKYEWYCTGCKSYFNKKHPELNPFSHKVNNEMIGYGTAESCFHGIIFRKKADD